MARYKVDGDEKVVPLNYESQSRGDGCGNDTLSNYFDGGMTIRTRIASEQMAAIISCRILNDTELKHSAKTAVKAADALLEALNAGC